MRKIFIINMLIFILCFDVFANRQESKYGSGYADTLYDETSFPYCGTGIINSIKMTQDDYTFYITFDIDYECPSLTYDANKNVGSSTNIVGSFIDKWDIKESTEFGTLFVSENANAGIYKRFSSNFSGGDSSGSTTYQGVLSFDGKYSNWNYKNGYNSKGNYTNTYEWNGNTYYIFPNTFWDIHADCNAYYTNGNSITYSETSKNWLNYWSYNVKGTIVLNKSDLIHYRYLNLCSPYAVMRYYYFYRKAATQDVSRIEYEGDGLYCNAIDLSNYTVCDHDWEIINIGDKTKHKKYCSKCDWTTMETHNLIYEYDGIENNMCECGYNEKVKYTFEINDDTRATISIICDSDGTIPPIEPPHKEGYKFDYYEKYELHLCDDTATPSTINNDLVEVFIATCSDIELGTSEYSTIYRAHFTPIHYSFHYSNENNLGLVLDGEIEDTTFEYDKMTRLPKHIHVDGYIFEGWTLATTSDVIVFKDCEEMKNYSIDDYATFTFYPRYRVQNFSIRYECSGGKFNNGNNVLVKTYSYFDGSELESLSTYSDESFFRFYTTDIDYNGVPNLTEKESGYNLYRKMSEVKKLLALYEKDNVVLMGHIGRRGDSTAEHTSDGGGLAPDGKGGFKNDIDKDDKNSIVAESTINGTIDDVNGDNLVENKKEKSAKKSMKEKIEDVLSMKGNIEVFDLSQTILENIGSLIATKSYLKGHNNANFSVFVCIMCLLQFINKYQVEIILFIFVIIIIVIYSKNS